MVTLRLGELQGIPSTTMADTAKNIPPALTGWLTLEPEEVIFKVLKALVGKVCIHCGCVHKSTLTTARKRSLTSGKLGGTRKQDQPPTDQANTVTVPLF